MLSPTHHRRDSTSGCRPGDPFYIRGSVFMTSFVQKICPIHDNCRRRSCWRTNQPTYQEFAVRRYVKEVRTTVLIEHPGLKKKLWRRAVLECRTVCFDRSRHHAIGPVREEQLLSVTAPGQPQGTVRRYTFTIVAERAIGVERLDVGLDRLYITCSGIETTWSASRLPSAGFRMMTVFEPTGSIWE